MPTPSTRPLRHLLVASAATALLLTGCSSNDAADDNDTTTTTASPDDAATGTASETVESAVEGVELGAEGPRAIIIDTTVEPPTDAVSWVALAAEDGCEIESGDTVTIDYSMALWSTGAIVEESTAANPIAVTADDAAAADQPPVALRSALVGHRVGERIGVVFPAGMDDLPGYFDAEGTYVLSVDIVESEKCGASESTTTAAES